MKKLLVLVILVCTSTLMFAQTTVNLNAFQMGVWSDTKLVWVWDNVKAIDLVLTVNKTTVSLNNQGQTELTIGASQGETKGVADDGTTYRTNKWTCIDQKYRRCTFAITIYSDGLSMYTIIYDDLIFRYIKGSARNSKYFND